MVTFDTNSSFSKILPNLQVGIDSTSLGEFKICPRRYQYSMVEGYEARDGQVHLVFGSLIHRARELYDIQRACDIGHEAALEFVVDDALLATWNTALQRPWISGNSYKNRVTLLRAIVWYLDQFQDDNLRTVRLASGKPAVELSFSFDTGLVASTGEPFVLCGHMDRLAEMNGLTYVVDVKTTRYSLDPKFFDSFTPDNQFSLYVLASKVAFAQPAEGLVLDAIQVGVNFVRCQRGMVLRSERAIEEWWNELGYWLRQMDQCAQANHWPQNDKSCNLYGGCRFRPVCARDPGAREGWLKTDYVKRHWDPLKVRGDI